MLADTFSPTEIRSFGKLMSSHYFDAIVIQQPLHTEETYSWSEFPTVLQKESELISSRPRKAADDELPKLSSPSPSPSLANSTHDVRKDPTIEIGAQDKIGKSKQSTKKTVRFAPVPQVRIYSLVLGDHPHCDDGLAIELGWEYSDALSMTSLENYKSIDNDNGGRSESGSIPRSSPRKSGGLSRSYLARKKLLLDVADCTNEELNQRLQEAKLSERQRARIERENYYYHLAFAGSRRIQ